MNIFSFTLDGFRILQLVLTVIIFAVSTSLTTEYYKNLKDTKFNKIQLLFTALTFVGTVGVFASASLFTMFFFFEIMSFASYGWVLLSNDKNAKKNADFYLYFSLVAGMVMLLGLFLLNGKLGTLELDEILTVAKGMDKTELLVPALLVMVGFGTKAGLYPLHVWLPTTYVTAPSPYTAVFSAILSKTGVFGAVMVSVNVFYYDELFGEIILVIAVITMLWGGISAIIQTDMKKTIAYSSMSQIGFIFVGVAMLGIMGEHNTIASWGTVLHMLNHSMFKLILFGLCSVIFMNIATTKFDDLKGIARKNPVIGALFLVAGCGLGGVPLFSGYISKTLLHESLVEQIHLHPSTLLTVSELLFILSGGFTVAYMLKIGMCLFAKNDNAPKIKFSLLNKTLLVLTAIPAVVMGILPEQTAHVIANASTEAMNIHAHELTIHYFNFTNLKGAIYSISIGLILYFVVVRLLLIKNGKYVEVSKGKLTLVNLIYLPVFTKLIPTVLGAVCRVLDIYVVQSFLNLIAIVMGTFSFVTQNITDIVLHLLIIFGFRPARERDFTVNVAYSYKIGKLLDAIANFVHKDKPHNYAEELETYEQNSAIRRRMISSSLSFGLLFAGIGIIVVLLYLYLG